MEYVAMLRALRVLKWFGIVLAALEALALYSALRNGHPNINMQSSVSIDGKTSGLPFGVLMLGALIGPLVVASFLAAGLDAEYKTIAIAWTRPISRLAIAGRYLAVGAAALFAAWAATLVAVVIPILAMGLAPWLRFQTGPDFVALALGTGCIIMWYGLVVAVSALLPGRGGAVAGMSWGAFLVMGILAAAPFPPFLHGIAVALNFLNPFAYIGSIGSGGANNILHLAVGPRAALAWAIGLVAVYAGVQLWATREVPA
jgi:hypothetical protein